MRNTTNSQHQPQLSTAPCCSVAWTLHIPLYPSIKKHQPPRKTALGAQPTMPRPLLTALLGGTLSSSCCLLQLLLNALGVGCAGFAALSPWRPVFVVATVVALAAAHARHRAWRRTAVAAAIALLLTTSPEWTEAVGRAGGVDGLVRWGAQRSTPPPTALNFRLTGVKCAACGERARSAAAAVPGIVSATVSWRDGRVRVGMDAGADAETTVAAVTAALTDAQFGVESVHPAAWHDEM